MEVYFSPFGGCPFDIAADRADLDSNLKQPPGDNRALEILRSADDVG